MTTWFSSLRITAKVAVLGAGLGLAVLGLGASALFAVSSLKEDLEIVARQGDAATRATRMNADVTHIRRLELRAAADASVDFADLRRQIAGYATSFWSNQEGLLAAADPGRRAVLEGLRSVMENYLASVERNLDAIARRQGEPNAIVMSTLPAYLRVNELTEGLASTAQAAKEREIAKAFADAAGKMVFTASAVAVSLVAGVLLVWLIGAQGIARPVADSVSRLRGLTEGDTVSPIPGVGRKDEIGDLAEAMQAFRDRLVAEREREGRERARIDADAARARRIAEATSRFESEARAVVRSVASAGGQVQATADRLSEGAGRTSERAGAAAGGAGQASTNVQTVASAAEELSASIREIAQRVAESSRMAAEAVAAAQKTNVTVEALTGSAQRIGDVVRLINDIAGQTNLLALNATIEAARAGEAGKGFAVVASEVKTLAAQTAKATEEISAQITAVQAETGHAVEAIRAISEAIERINSVLASVAAAVEEQGAATAEIARSVQDAARATHDVSGNIRVVSELAEATMVSARDMQEAARVLNRNAEELGREIEHYIAEVKAA